MSDNKTIIDDISDDELEGVIKNPNRQKREPVSPQEPNYVRLGKDPIIMDKRTVPTAKKKPAEKSAEKSLEVLKIGQLPAITSTQSIMEPQETVSMINNKIVDEEGNTTPIEQGHFIDNNDFVLPPNTPFFQTRRKDPSLPQQPVETTTTPVLGQPRIGEYILMVFGKIVDTGTLSQIEGVVRAILYGENEQYIGQEVKEEDIVVLKRVNVQVGIFVDRE